MAKDLYQILGVKRDASDDEIRKAYRKLARKHHPDVNPGNKKAEDHFKEVAAAYEVLGDKEKRKNYNEFGEDALRGGFDPEKARAYQQWQAGRQQAGRPAGGDGEYGEEFDLSDLFGGGRRGGRMPGQDILARVDVDLPQALNGVELSVEVPAHTTCPTCSGSGDEPGAKVETCPVCKGSGKQQVAQGPMRMMMTCRKCGGRGKLSTPCHTCGGAREVVTRRPITVRIPPGADEGSRLRVTGQGAPGDPPGDLVIETHVRPHPHFRREGLDLHLTLPVTLSEALSGAAIDVPTPQGSVKLTVPARSQSGTKLRLKGRGVKRGKEQGDLYVELAIRLPEGEDERLAEAARGARYEKPVREGLRL